MVTHETGRAAIPGSPRQAFLCFRCKYGFMRHSHAPEALLITSAAVSSDEEYDRRRRKYAVMMSIRGLCVIAAACTYQFSIWLALAFMVGGAVLPWCAVLIANNGPVKKRVPTPVYRPGLGTERALTAGDDGRTIDG